MAKYKTGIIGCGGIANGKHMPALSRMADVEMVAFCDIIPERADAAVEKYGCGKAVYDYHEIAVNMSDSTVNAENLRSDYVFAEWKKIQ